MKPDLYKYAVLTSILGLLSFTVVLITKTAYPDLLFCLLAPVGLLLVLFSLGLYAADWMLSYKRNVKTRNYLGAFLLLLAAVAFIVSSVI